MTNVFEPDWDAVEGGGSRRARVGRQVGSERIGISLYELPPASAPFPCHYQYANQELLIVLQGRPHLRTPDGWRQLDEGELVAFPRGREA